MEGGTGFIIIAIVGLTSLILPLASVVILVNLSRKIEDLEKKIDKLTGVGVKKLEQAPSIQTSVQ